MVSMKLNVLSATTIQNGSASFIQNLVPRQKIGNSEKGSSRVKEIRRRKENRGVKGVGSGVLSHPVTRAVPSALVSLTTGFGMGPGVPSRL